jgi:hypothetical protein
MLKRIVPLLLAVFCALVLVSAASAARGMKLGIYDSAQALGNTSQAFGQFSELRMQVVRVTLNWRDVSLTKPAFGTFDDPASYRWSKPGVYDYDDVVRAAAARNIGVMFTILDTPAWAGGGTRGQLAPTNMAWLQAFARAAATRYSGVYADSTGALLPRVRYWTAWNEPNSPNFLRPQYKRINGRWVIWSARRYAQMCTAVFRGVHTAEAASAISPRGKVACGVTNPGGNNYPRGRRGAPTPLPFIRAMKAGKPKFDVFAHHPYASRPLETPTTLPSSRTRITLANLGVLIRELNRLGWGSKRVWLTEYGYQTKPPDGNFGVTPTKQAAYLRQSYAIAKRNRRVDMFVWFLLKDELEVGRWQSGLIWTFPSKDGVKKPSYAAFQALRG